MMTNLVESVSIVIARLDVEIRQYQQDCIQSIYQIIPIIELAKAQTVGFSNQELE